AREQLADALLKSGQFAAAVAEADALLAALPLDEFAWEILIRALSGGGRTAEALDAYRRAYASLSAVWLEPSPPVAPPPPPPRPRPRLCGRLPRCRVPSRRAGWRTWPLWRNSSTAGRWSRSSGPAVSASPPWPARSPGAGRPPTAAG